MCVDGALIAGGHGLQDHVVGTVAGRGNQCGVISGTFTPLMLGDLCAADLLQKKLQQTLKSQRCLQRMKTSKRIKKAQAAKRVFLKKVSDKLVI